MMRWLPELAAVGRAPGSPPRASKAGVLLCRERAEGKRVACGLHNQGSWPVCARTWGEPYKGALDVDASKALQCNVGAACCLRLAGC
eukprot:7997494-Alexandrium_andersonii.AAC.1